MAKIIHNNEVKKRDGLRVVTIIDLNGKKIKLVYDVCNGSSRHSSSASLLTSNGWVFLASGLDIDWEPASYVSGEASLNTNACVFYDAMVPYLETLYK